MHMHTGHHQFSLKEKQRLERENLILAAAEDAFLEKGFHETSMDEIAARVGIAKGTVYLHFACKEDLLIAIFTKEMQQNLQNLDAISQTDADIETKLKTIIRDMYIGLYSKQTRLMASLYNTTNPQKLFKEKGAPIHEIWTAMMERIGTLLDEGKRTGVFDATIPTPVMLLAFSNIFSPRPTNKLIPGIETVNEEIMEYLIRIYFSGIT
jgi:TetR/AcrR family transcriptional regulator, fatty acid metabolism regulator protein